MFSGDVKIPSRAFSMCGMVLSLCTASAPLWAGPHTRRGDKGAAGNADVPEAATLLPRKTDAKRRKRRARKPKEIHADDANSTIAAYQQPQDMDAQKASSQEAVLQQGAAVPTTASVSLPHPLSAQPDTMDVASSTSRKKGKCKQKKRTATEAFQDVPQGSDKEADEASAIATVATRETGVSLRIKSVNGQHATLADVGVIQQALKDFTATHGLNITRLQLWEDKGLACPEHAHDAVCPDQSAAKEGDVATDQKRKKRRKGSQRNALQRGRTLRGSQIPLQDLDVKYLEQQVSAQQSASALLRPIDDHVQAQGAPPPALLRTDTVSTLKLSASDDDVNGGDEAAQSDDAKSSQATLIDDELEQTHMDTTPTALTQEAKTGLPTTTATDVAAHAGARRQNLAKRLTEPHAKVFGAPAAAQQQPGDTKPYDQQAMQALAQGASLSLPLFNSNNKPGGQAIKKKWPHLPIKKGS